MFAAAIFDMDGLLIDSERPIMAAWIEAARTLDIELSHSQYLQVVGLAMTESEHILASLLGGPDAYNHAVAHVRQRLQLERSDGAPLFPIKPGAAEFLSALRERGTRCAVASSSTSGQIQACLGSLSVLHHFSAFAGGDEVARAKPDPALYLLAAERLGVDPAECIAFEDSENGARAAQAAGVRVVIVPDLKQPSPEVAARAHGVIGSLAEAVAHVPHWFPQL
jgi:HAD superfamily hydrolase (TIGR01509 family)